MTQYILRTGALLILVVLAGTACARPAITFDMPRFGKITVYPPAGEPRQIVLFVSGDGGWNLGVVSMARSLARMGALVAGIDITHYIASLNQSAENCSTPDVDFERLGHVLEAKYAVRKYREPILVGYSSGATLVYGTLAQAPVGTFVGALSLGFCPDLEVKQPLCKGSGIESEPLPKHNGFNLLPVSHLTGHWIALQGSIDQVCLPGPTQDFVEKVPGAELVMLPHVGHGFSVERNWMPQYKAAFQKIAARQIAATPVLPPAVSDLPLVEVPAPATERKEFAVVLSGDGGWVGIDREMAGEFAKHGIPVVGWDSLKYFWTARTPEEAGRDLDRIINHYVLAWQRDRVVLVGYSQGADVLPFMVNRLSPLTRMHVVHSVLLGPGHEAFFEFHISHWLGRPTGGLLIKPEAEKLRGNSVACLYGEDDEDSICPELEPGGFSIIKLAGGHHFGGDYESVARIIIEGLPTAAMPQSVTAERTAGSGKLVDGPNVYGRTPTHLH